MAPEGGLASEAKGEHMRYVVEFELRSDLGAALTEAIQNALSPFGNVVNLRIVPMQTYTWNVQLSKSVHVNPQANG
jgi:hypothetical protein